MTTELVKVADLTKPQRSVVESVPRGIKLMRGPAGTGKTTAGIRRMLRLLTKDRVFANEILVLVPQRALGLLYDSAANAPSVGAGGRITVTTIGGLSRTVTELFFPLVADAAHFVEPNRQPIFLTLESAQYHMARVVGPLIQNHAYFSSVAIAQNRLYSQIIDNLNKAALVGFPHTQIADRLIAAWGDKDPQQEIIYQQAQEGANAFRAYCLKQSLIDFSLQIELFRSLWKMKPVQNYLTQRYKHLIIDNIEEDTPITHDILLDWIPETESTLIIEDTDAGFRRFLGAAPESASRVSALVTTQRDLFEFTEADSLVSSPAIQALGAQIGSSLTAVRKNTSTHKADPLSALEFDQPRFHTEMIDNVAEVVSSLIYSENVPPSEIAILSPFLSDSLRYTLTERLNQRGISTHSHRPSRALREEPYTQALITIARLAHPTWKLTPTTREVVHALVNAIQGMDLTRAQLAASHLYKQGQLNAFDALTSGVQTRITYALGEKLQELHRWLLNYHEDPLAEIDLFWTQLFGEVLSARGFGFHDTLEAAENAATLIDSATKFRHMMAAVPQANESRPIAQEYIELVMEGVIADQYLRRWANIQNDEDSILLAPAYTFLMSNRPVDYQFWLNVGSSGWWERLYQPLTHPYVLTRNWKLGDIWTDEDEFRSRNQTMYHLTLGLLRRCRKGVYLGFSELGEQGFEQRGPLLDAFRLMFRRLNAIE